MIRRSNSVSGAVIALCALALSAPGGGVDSAAAADFGASAKDTPASSWWDTVKFSGYAQGGVTFNGDDPANGLNFGHLFTDKADDVLLNQLSLTLERPIDSKRQYDLGFKLQGMYGSDARYTHFLGEFDESIDDRNQFDIVEAYLLFHTPWLGEGGTDIKIGQYVTLEGAEVIDPRYDYLYSHTYIFNFGIPFKHTGVLATTIVNSTLSLYYGIDTGVNTTFGDEGDPNDAAAFHGGFGLNLMGGALTALVTTHIGPETPDNNHDYRYLNDATIVWKITDKLTSITDLNYARDDAGDADGYGVAQYYVYAFNDWLTGVIRSEVWRDDDGFFVAAFPGNLDFVHLEKGEPNGSFGFGATTYKAFTVGLNIKPPVRKPFEGLVIRPEVRYDHSSDTKPFDSGTSDDQFTFGVDVVAPFSIIP